MKTLIIILAIPIVASHAQSNFQIGLANNAKISKSKIEPLQFYFVKSGWTDWVNFYTPQLFFKFRNKNNSLEIAYTSNSYSNNYRMSGQYFDTATRSTFGGGGIDEYVTTDDFSFILSKNITPKSKLNFDLGVGVNFILAKTKHNSSSNSYISSSQHHSFQIDYSRYNVKPFGFGLISSFELRYTHKKTTFYLSYEYQVGLKYFSYYNINVRFDKDYFQGQILSKGDAMMLGLGISRQLNFAKWKNRKSKKG